MSVYNGEKYLSEAIESILHQIFSDFEFLIINDGSTDRSVEIIKQYNDPRILLVHNPTNVGLAVSLNKGIDLAQGQYIARMDSDDISHPERLKKQVEFMDTHSEIGICGTWTESINELKPEHSGRIWKGPISNDEIKVSLIFESALAHPSVIIRKSRFAEHNLSYNSSFVTAQDFDLWHQCSEHFALANLPEVLLKYRITSSSISRRVMGGEKQQEIMKQIYGKALASLNISLKEDNFKLHWLIGTHTYSANREFVKKACRWLLKLHRANRAYQRYSEPSFSRNLANRWFWICYHAMEQGPWVWKVFWRSPLSKFNTVSWGMKFSFFIHVNKNLRTRILARYLFPLLDRVTAFRKSSDDRR